MRVYAPDEDDDSSPEEAPDKLGEEVFASEVTAFSLASSVASSPASSSERCGTVGLAGLSATIFSAGLASEVGDTSFSTDRNVGDVASDSSRRASRLNRSKSVVGALAGRDGVRCCQGSSASRGTSMES